MSKTYIFEGNTTNAAIEKGLQELKISREQAEIKVLEENKKSFFSILAPRVVKVEFILKDKKPIVKEKKEIVVSEEKIEEQKIFIEKFVKEFFEKLSIENVKCDLKYEENIIKLNVNAEKANTLIGYRGETLNSLESIINIICKQNKFLLRVSCNINDFREKREVVLRELAEKVSKTVLKTRKSITLEPMIPYERKIIHTALQNHTKIKTYSIGEGNGRRLVIALK